MTTTLHELTSSAETTSNKTQHNHHAYVITIPALCFFTDLCWHRVPQLSAVLQDSNDTLLATDRQRMLS